MNKLNYPQMASLLQSVGDVIPFRRQSIEPGMAVTEGAKTYPGGANVTPMPGAQRPPLFQSYEASKAKATDNQKYDYMAQAQKEWKGNWALRETYKTPEELYQMYLAMAGLKP